jgi:hypothetical protein
MTLNPNAWFVKWFFWSCHMIDHFWLTQSGRFYSSRAKKYKNGTNLCHFFRTLLWGSLMTVAVAGLYLYGIFVILILPFIEFQTRSIFEVIGIILAILAGLAILVGSIWGLIHVFVITLERIRDWREANCDKSIEKIKPKLGFIFLAMEYLRAIKQRICPLISFGGTDNA